MEVRPLVHEHVESLTQATLRQWFILSLHLWLEHVKVASIHRDVTPDTKSPPIQSARDVM